MLLVDFLSQNLHFVTGLFAALVFFAVFWLYFDAWLANRDEVKEIFRWAGFLLLSLSFLVYATVIEQSVLGRSLLGDKSEMVSGVLRLLGFLSIVIGELMDPLQAVPEDSGLETEDFVPETPAEATAAETETARVESAKPAGKGKGKKAKKSKSAMMLTAASTTNLMHWLTPLGALAVALFYWRRATTGLERHLKPVAYAFGLLFGFELLSLTRLWTNSTNPTLARLAEAFGPVWWLTHLLLLASALVLGWWVWQYLTKRFVSQLFMIFTSMILAVFLVTTVSFTYLLLSNVQTSSLNNLGTAAGVLNYAINSKKTETRADSQTIGENAAVAAAVSAADHNQLASLTSGFLNRTSTSSLMITDTNAQVLLRAENPDHYGDSVSSDTVVRRALIGEDSSSVSSQPGVLAPVIYIRSASPIRNAQQQIVGAAVVSLVLDNAFVSGIKTATGLDSSIYAGNEVAATTFLAPDGLSRWVGVKETSSAVDNTVLKNAQTYKGSVSVLNRQFLGVFTPLKDVNNNIVGMLFIGQPSVDIIRAAGHSIELTFIVTAALMLLSIVPAFVVARYISGQLE